MCIHLGWLVWNNEEPTQKFSKEFSKWAWPLKGYDPLKSPKSAIAGTAPLVSILHKFC